MDEFKIKGYEHIFRIKQMNAIETLSLQTQINFDDLDSTEKLFYTFLERIEVKAGNTWLPVKTKGRNIFYPDGVENDLMLVKELVAHFMNDYLKPVFSKSNELKK